MELKGTSCVVLNLVKNDYNHDVVFNEEEFPGLKSDGAFCQDDSICQDYNVGVKVELTHLESCKTIGPGSSTQFQEKDSFQQHWKQGCDDYQLAKDRQRRVIRPLKYDYEDIVVFALTTTSGSLNQELESYQQAMSCDDKEKWQKAMENEIGSLYKKKTWVLVERPKDMKFFYCKWIYNNNNKIK